MIAHLLQQWALMSEHLDSSLLLALPVSGTRRLLHAPMSAHMEIHVRPNQRSLDAGGALGLLLHYLNSTMHEISLQQIFALIPATVSRYVTSGLPILLHTLRSMPDATIQWPSGPDFERCSALVVARHPLLEGAFGSIDGLKPAVTIRQLLHVGMSAGGG
jgi:hypothetical protein